jgi:hypothetical protein
MWGGDKPFIPKLVLRLCVELKNNTCRKKHALFVIALFHGGRNGRPFGMRSNTAAIVAVKTE